MDGEVSRGVSPERKKARLVHLGNELIGRTAGEDALDAAGARDDLKAHGDLHDSEWQHYLAAARDRVNWMEKNPMLNPSKVRIDTLELLIGASRSLPVPAKQKVKMMITIRKDPLKDAVVGFRSRAACLSPKGTRGGDPLDIAFSADRFFMHVTDSSGREVARVIIFITQKGALVWEEFGDYEYDLEDLIAQALLQLAHFSPSVMVDRTSAGFLGLGELESTQTKSVTLSRGPAELYERDHGYDWLIEGGHIDSHDEGKPGYWWSSQDAYVLKSRADMRENVQKNLNSQAAAVRSEVHLPDAVNENARKRRQLEAGLFKTIDASSAPSTLTRSEVRGNNPDQRQESSDSSPQTVARPEVLKTEVSVLGARFQVKTEIYDSIEILSLKALQEEDIEQLIELQRRLVDRGYISSDALWYRERIESILRGGDGADSVIAVYRRNGRIAGYVYGTKFRGVESRIGWISDVSVAEESEGEGIGTSLLAFGIHDLAIRKGAKRIWLWARDQGTREIVEKAGGFVNGHEEDFRFLKEPADKADASWAAMSIAMVEPVTEENEARSEVRASSSKARRPLHVTKVSQRIAQSMSPWEWDEVTLDNVDPAFEQWVLAGQMDAGDLDILKQILSGNEVVLQDMLKNQPSRVQIDEDEKQEPERNGRTVYLNLKKPFPASGGQVEVLRIKGARPRSKDHSNETDSHKGDGFVSRPIVVSPNGDPLLKDAYLRSNGEIRGVRSEFSTPQGSMLKEKADKEYRIMREGIKNKGFETDYPIAAGLWNHKEHLGRATGFVIAGMRQRKDLRISLRGVKIKDLQQYYFFSLPLIHDALMKEATLVVDPGHLLSDKITGQVLETNLQMSKIIYEKVGRSIRAYHDAGYLHRYPHNRNWGVEIDSTGGIRVILRDLDTTKMRDEIGEKESKRIEAGYRFLDVHRIIADLSAEGSAEYSWAYGLKEPPKHIVYLAEAFLHGYFYGERIEKNELARIVDDVTTQDFAFMSKKIRKYGGKIFFSETLPIFGRLWKYLYGLSVVQETFAEPQSSQVVAALDYTKTPKAIPPYGVSVSLAQSPPKLRRTISKQHQQIVKPKLSLAVDRDVVFVMSKEIIQALTAEEKKELLCVLHENPKMSIIIPDGLKESDASVQLRIDELVKAFPPSQISLSGAVLAHLKDVPAVFLGNMEGLSAKEQLDKLAPELEGRLVICYGYRRPAAGKSEIPISFGVPLFAAVGNIAMNALRQQNGFFYDDGRIAEQIRSELRDYTVISTSA